MFEQGIEPAIPQMPFFASDKHICEAKALTAGMITMIDDHIGRVIDALKSSGEIRPYRDHFYF